MPHSEESLAYEVQTTPRLRSSTAPRFLSTMQPLCAERLVRVAFADGEVLDYRGGERGAELLWAQWMPRADSPGYYKCRGIRGWWDSGFWHPTIGSPTWRMTGRVGDMCPPEQ